MLVAAGCGSDTPVDVRKIWGGGGEDRGGLSGSDVNIDCEVPTPAVARTDDTAVTVTCP